MVGRPQIESKNIKKNRQWTKKYYLRKDKDLNNGGYG
jgi:hypothetical protein